MARCQVTNQIPQPLMFSNDLLRFSFEARLIQGLRDKRPSRDFPAVFYVALSLGGCALARAINDELRSLFPRAYQTCPSQEASSTSNSKANRHDAGKLSLVDVHVNRKIRSRKRVRFTSQEADTTKPSEVGERTDAREEINPTTEAESSQPEGISPQTLKQPCSDVCPISDI